MSALNILRAGDFPGLYTAFRELEATREQVIYLVLVTGTSRYLRHTFRESECDLVKCAIYRKASGKRRRGR